MKTYKYTRKEALLKLQSLFVAMVIDGKNPNKMIIVDKDKLLKFSDVESIFGATKKTKKKCPCRNKTCNNPNGEKHHLPFEKETLDGLKKITIRDNSICSVCGGLIPEPNKSYGYTGKWCECKKITILVERV